MMIMSLRPLLLACSLTLLPGWAAAQDWPAPDRQDWQRYVVPETRASVDIPTAVFSDDAGVADSGPGRRFVTADGRANLIVQSVPNATNDSPATFLAKKRPPANIVYRRVTPSFFVVSSFRDDKIWYNRCNRGRAAMHCVLINYPAAEKRQWDAVVTRISRTLTSGT
jgi:hypothetical protein